MVLSCSADWTARKGAAYGMDELHADDVGRAIALSERFASEGEMNLSKLLDAAVYADVRRSGWMHRPAVTRATMEGELRTTIERLKARHADDWPDRGARAGFGQAGSG